MENPITFIVPQLNPEQVHKSGEIAQAFTALQRTITNVLGNSPDVAVMNIKLEEAWLYANKALVTTARRVAA